MFCPRCGSTQDEELKFCKSCGANLHAVRQAVDIREPDVKWDASKPWYAQLAVSDAESKRRKEELDHKRGISAEIKRHNEIKAGVITGSVGLAVAIFLSIFMQGIILGGKVSDETAEILSRLWVVGIIPILVGLALIVNGVFISRRLAEIVRRAAFQPASSPVEKETHPLELPSADTSEFTPQGFSVIEGTTRHLTNSERK